MKKFLTFLTLISSFLSAESDSLFCYESSTDLASQVTCQFDMIVLEDGTRLCGRVESLPSVKFPFGTVSLNPESFSTVTFLKEKDPMLRALTRERQPLVGTVSHDKIIFFQYLASQGSWERQELSINGIDYILLQARKRKCPPFSTICHQLRFQNGDELPAVILQKTIAAHDGYKTLELNTSDIQFLTLVEKMKGIMEDSNGNYYAFLKDSLADQSLKIAIPMHHGTFEVPWDHLMEISLEKEGESSIDRYSYVVGNTEIHERFQHELPGVSLAFENLNQPKPLLEDFQEKELLKSVVFEDLLEENLEIASMGQPPLFREEEIQALLEDEEISFVEDSSMTSELAEEPIVEGFFGFVSSTAKAIRNTFSKSEKTEPSPPPSRHRLWKVIHRGMDFFSSFWTSEQPEVFRTEELPEEDLATEWNHLCQPLDLELTRAPPLLENSSQHHATIAWEQMTFIPGVFPTKRSFYVDKKRVTNAEYRKFVQETGYACPSHWENGHIPEGMEQRPVVNVSYEGALQYAKWSGKRLPTYEDLNYIQEKSVALEDTSDFLDEWTSTPTAVPYDIDAISCQLSTSYSTREMPKGYLKVAKLHTGEEAVPLRQDEMNGYTGFRCVADLQ